ncbi:hypothetical protein CMEL01_13489 [Colletotrichum melonis]|uniref:Uncharacterized protein n=1 Tax=Colletotrichum melonis TaxID=1209925 RepID=A0AAI9XX85_9PEZI|nr:hypothetical protein CMEL01_13489 [Colletotrichum melonis]
MSLLQSPAPSLPFKNKTLVPSPYARVSFPSVSLSPSSAVASTPPGLAAVSAIVSPVVSRSLSVSLSFPLLGFNFPSTSCWSWLLTHLRPPCGPRRPIRSEALTFAAKYGKVARNRHFLQAISKPIRPSACCSVTLLSLSASPRCLCFWYLALVHPQSRTLCPVPSEGTEYGTLLSTLPVLRRSMCEYRYTSNTYDC